MPPITHILSNPAVTTMSQDAQVTTIKYSPVPCSKIAFTGTNDTEEVLNLNQKSKSYIMFKGTSSSTSRITSHNGLVFGLRMGILLLILAGYVWSNDLQGRVDATWQFLQKSWWFQTVYFETYWATMCYAIIVPLYPFAFHHIHWFNRYKITPSVTYIKKPVLDILTEIVVYMSPLAFLDTFIVKRYYGVDPEQWQLRQQSWIQTTRALPEAPPSVGQLLFQVLGSVLLYDAMFFFLHLMLHKSRFLYTHLHAKHHNHGVMHAHITNQLTICERVMLVLAANQALKFLSSHPLSRAAFVPVFVFLLVDNHSGYDLPWGLQHILPANILGGPRMHYAHHMQGIKHFQPFLTYLDVALEWWEDHGNR